MMNWGDFFERFIWGILGLGAILLVILLLIIVAAVIIEIVNVGITDFSFAQADT